MGIRVIKTAAAAVIAIYLAQGLELTNAFSAGLLAILGIEVTKKKGLKSAVTRILASVLGMLVAMAAFTLFGYQVWVISIFLLIVYPILVWAKLQDGIVTSSVIMLHLFAYKTVTLALLGNEILLLVIGFGVATVINLLYMPKAYRELELEKCRVEKAFSGIFEEIAAHLVDPDRVWDGQELLEVLEGLSRGEELARHSAENSIFQEEEHWVRYFDMRKQQADSIQRMLDLVSRVYQTVPHGEAVSRLFGRLSEDVKSEHYEGTVERELLVLEEEFKRMPLPETRLEFEVRSAILQLCYELESFLSVAKELKKQKKPAAAGET